MFSSILIRFSIFGFNLVLVIKNMICASLIFLQTRRRANAATPPTVNATGHLFHLCELIFVIISVMDLCRPAEKMREMKQLDLQSVVQDTNKSS